MSSESDEKDRLHAQAMRHLQVERRELMATRTRERGLRGVEL